MTQKIKSIEDKAPHLVRPPPSSISGLNPEHIFCSIERDVAPTDRISSLPLGETEEEQTGEEGRGNSRLFVSVLETWKQRNKHVFGRWLGGRERGRVCGGLIRA